jgi:transposase
MKRHLHLIDMIFLVFVIGVQEENYVASAVFQAKYKCWQLSSISLSKYAYSRMIGEVLLENLGSIVGRSIIDHYYLFRKTRLRKDAVDCFNNEATVVIRTYDHRHSHICSLARCSAAVDFRTPGKSRFIAPRQQLRNASRQMRLTEHCTPMQMISRLSPPCSPRHRRCRVNARLSGFKWGIRGCWWWAMQEDRVSFCSDDDLHGTCEAGSQDPHRERNLIERFFNRINRIKHHRRVATRYEKLGANFLAI